MENTIDLNLPAPTPARRLYFCDYCERRYLSPQALGGHQNAHRKERAAARYRRFLQSRSPNTDPAMPIDPKTYYEHYYWPTVLQPSTSQNVIVPFVYVAPFYLPAPAQDGDDGSGEYSDHHEELDLDLHL